MKTAIIGIVSAIIGGFILFALQGVWSNYQTSNLQRIDFHTSQDEITTAKEQLAALEKESVESDSSVSFVLVKVRNTGSADLADKSFSLVTSSILGYSSVSSPNNNPKNLDLSYDHKVFNVKSKILPKGAESSFWIAKSDSIDFDPLKFSADSAGVDLTLSPDPTSVDPFPWSWIGIAIGAFFILLSGIVWGEISLTMKLGKKEVNVVEILKSRPEAAPLE